MVDGLALPRLGPLAADAPVSVTPLPPMTRLSARGDTRAAERFGAAFQVSLPHEALRANEAEGRAALWLGPDEWLLLAPEDDGLAATVERGLDGAPGCIVDVSHRQGGLAVVGPGAEAVLSAGCPLDLGEAAFPVGMATRTVLAKADIVLWRRAAKSFHVECWRSFTPYVVAFLAQATADNAG